MKFHRLSLKPMNSLSRGNWASLTKWDKWRQKWQVTHELKCTHTPVKSSQLAPVMSKHQCNKLFYVSWYIWQWKLEFTFLSTLLYFTLPFAPNKLWINPSLLLPYFMKKVHYASSKQVSSTYNSTTVAVLHAQHHNIRWKIN